MSAVPVPYRLPDYLLSSSSSSGRQAPRQTHLHGSVAWASVPLAPSLSLDQQKQWDAEWVAGWNRKWEEEVQKRWDAELAKSSSPLSSQPFDGGEDVPNIWRMFVMWLYAKLEEFPAILPELQHDSSVQQKRMDAARRLALGLDMFVPEGRNGKYIVPVYERPLGPWAVGEQTSVTVKDSELEKTWIVNQSEYRGHRMPVILDLARFMNPDQRPSRSGLRPAHKIHYEVLVFTRFVWTQFIKLFDTYRRLHPPPAKRGSVVGQIATGFAATAATAALQLWYFSRGNDEDRTQQICLSGVEDLLCISQSSAYSVAATSLVIGSTIGTVLGSRLFRKKQVPSNVVPHLHYLWLLTTLPTEEDIATLCSFADRGNYRALFLEKEEIAIVQRYSPAFFKDVVCILARCDGGYEYFVGSGTSISQEFRLRTSGKCDASRVAWRFALLPIT